MKVVRLAGWLVDCLGGQKVGYLDESWVDCLGAWKVARWAVEKVLMLVVYLVEMMADLLVV